MGYFYDCAIDLCLHFCSTFSSNLTNSFDYSENYIYKQITNQYKYIKLKTAKDNEKLITFDVLTEDSRTRWTNKNKEEVLSCRAVELYN